MKRQIAAYYNPAEVVRKDYSDYELVYREEQSFEVACYRDAERVGNMTGWEDQTVRECPGCDHEFLAVDDQMHCDICGPVVDRLGEDELNRMFLNANIGYTGRPWKFRNTYSRGHSKVGMK